ncbi:MAG: SpaA isopeptide-forming pilin-related protein, partial [Acidimicrobiia bacterium]|nr:SpaA isopeptide-forming pilin-related protein [Acidimicrobiia bacterium]
MQFPMMVLAAVLLVALAVGPALAGHPEVSLPGSAFEIDTDANLVLDDSPGIDWATVAEERRDDQDSGTGDNSFGQGSKEDTAVPAVVSGSIPPNKSDLKTFGIYQEESASGKFLHLYWTRVQDPSGTTNMDFEFNKSTTLSANGVTPIRSIGDLLITYDLSRGGTVPTLSLRTWTGSAWGPATDLSGSGNATGSINTSSITAGNSDGLGPLSPRTFGEASIDLDVIFDSGKCESFGSAYLKSRSSDSFTAALKDFIAPLPINIANCGKVQIEKVNDIEAPLAGATFTLYTDDGDDDFEPGTDDAVALDPNGVAQTCTTDSSGFCTIDDVLFGDYWIDETQVPADHDKATGLPTRFTVSGTSTVKLGPYTNVRQRGSILIEKVVTATDTRISGASFALDVDGNPDTTDDQTPIPGVGTGVFCIDGLTYGTYTVVETEAPDGFLADTESQTFEVSTKSDCDTRSTIPDLTFENTAQPSIETSATSTTVGGVLSDTATLAGGFNPTGTITFTLYSDAECKTSVFTDTEAVDGNGDYTTDPTYLT